jgi:hypothetical protein
MRDEQWQLEQRIQRIRCPRPSAREQPGERGAEQNRQHGDHRRRGGREGERGSQFRIAAELLQSTASASNHEGGDRQHQEREQDAGAGGGASECQPMRHAVA